MTNRTLNGWLIHCQPNGESSVFVSLLTEERGLIKVSYPGGQSRKRKPNLHLFTPIWIDIIERNQRTYCQSIEPKTPPPYLTGLSLCCAYYLNELIFKTLKQPEPEQALFNAYEEAMSALQHDQTTIIERGLRQFEWTLLMSQGHGYSFELEGDQQTVIEATGYYQFKPGYGFFIADQGIAGKQLLAIATHGLIDKESLKIAKKIMRQAIDYLVEYQPIHARKMIINPQ